MRGMNSVRAKKSQRRGKEKSWIKLLLKTTNSVDCSTIGPIAKRLENRHTKNIQSLSRIAIYCITTKQHLQDWPLLLPPPNTADGTNQHQTINK